MKRLTTWTIAAAVALTAGGAAIAADVEQSLKDIHARSTGAMAFLQATYEDELGSRQVGGICMCIDGSGVLMTAATDGRMNLESFKDVKVVLPGVEGKSLDAEFISIDLQTGLGFLRVKADHDWSVIQFVGSSKVSPGAPVFSLGLLGEDTGFKPYLGQAYVSTVLRMPGPLALTTGGSLTAEGSPVFNAAGRAIGLVGRQPFLDYQTVTQRGQIRLRLAGQQQTKFFTPVDEFAHVISNIPGPDERLPWIGALGVEPVTPEYAKIVGVDGPAVQINRVIPGDVADKAGLKDGDVIVAMDGEPLEQLSTPALTTQNFMRSILRRDPGRKITLTVVRDEKEVPVDLTLGEMPERPDEAPRYVSRPLGFAIRDKVMLDEYTIQGQAARTPGVVAILVGENSPAARGGLQRGDVITGINDKAISSVDAAGQIISAAVANQPGQVLNMLVYRGDEQEAVSIQIPAQR